MHDVHAKIIQRYNHVRRFAYISVYWNIGMAVYKTVFGLVVAAYFLCVNGVFTLFLGVLKYMSVYAYKKYFAKPGETDYYVFRHKQNSYYRFIGVCIIISGIMYNAYCMRFFSGLPNTNYGVVIAVVLAGITIAEIFLSVHGAILTRREREPLMEALKLINLSSSLITYVLAQSAMLSFASMRVSDFTNGLTGVIMGSIVSVIGVYMILHIKDISSGKTEIREIRTVKKYLERIELANCFELIGFEDIVAHRPRLLVRMIEYSQSLFQIASTQVGKKFGFELVLAEKRV